MLKESNFITLPAFLRTRLNLKGNELIITSLIYGFSQDGSSWFMGKTEYIEEWMGLSEKSILQILKKLTDEGILEKKDICVAGRAKRCYYRFNPKCLETNKDEVSRDDLQKVSRNNNIYIDNIIDNIKTPGNEFPGLFEEIEQPKKLRGTTEPRSCLFENSRFANFEEFEKCFTNPDYEQIDIFHYYNVVKDWSASIGKKRKDWIAQARNIMRSDKEKGKLHFKPQYQPRSQKIDLSGALEYLNDDY